ncbi:hypothetical protein R3P38DRAFT_277065 [Favolaschia claudopus]|uniref:Yeast cell wall synthesis Kre9/Knh1-like N-terminal domain-containing protein n=1 Tax=Favolaschia claudopus TaxID=2862362 RepID=A0AAV9ZQ44_9AGAR
MFNSFTKLCVSILAFSGAAAAISNLQAPSSPVAGKPITITWSSTSEDKEPVTLALFSTKPTFNGGYAIANPIHPKANKATVMLPDVVPGNGFTLAFISMSDTSKILATSPEFEIAGTGTAESTATHKTTAAHGTATPSAASAHHPTQALVNATGSAAGHASNALLPTSIISAATSLFGSNSNSISGLTSQPTPSPSASGSMQSSQTRPLLSTALSFASSAVHSATNPSSSAHKNGAPTSSFSTAAGVPALACLFAALLSAGVFFGVAV